VASKQQAPAAIEIVRPQQSLFRPWRSLQTC